MEKTQQTQQPATPPPAPQSFISKVVSEAGDALGFAESHITDLFAKAGELRDFITKGEALITELGARQASGAAIEADVRDLVAVVGQLTSNPLVKRVCADIAAGIDADIKAQK